MGNNATTCRTKALREQQHQDQPPSQQISLLVRHIDGDFAVSVAADCSVLQVKEAIAATMPGLDFHPRGMTLHYGGEELSNPLRPLLRWLRAALLLRLSSGLQPCSCSSGLPG